LVCQDIIDSDFKVFICTTGGLDAANTMDTFNIYDFQLFNFQHEIMKVFPVCSRASFQTIHMVALTGLCHAEF